ncbi:MAG: hypothetical protein V4736_06495 [Bdellovibrionota bacterium]
MGQMDKPMDNVSSKVNGAAKSASQNIQHGLQQGQQIGQQAGSQAMTSLNDIKSFISDEAPDYLKHALTDLKVAATRYADVSKTTINRYPLYSVAGAVAAGALIGLFLGRSRK